MGEQPCMCDYCVDKPFSTVCSRVVSCDCGFCAICFGNSQKAELSENSTAPVYDYTSFSPRPRKTLCTNSDIHRIIENAVARKAQKPIPRVVLDKHVAEIAKIRFNPNVKPVDVEQVLYELADKVVDFKTRHDPNIYRQIALCAILLADASESGKW